MSGLSLKLHRPSIRILWKNYIVFGFDPTNLKLKKVELLSFLEIRR